MRTAKSSINDTLELAHRLRDIPSEKAPKTLLPSVLRRLGLGHEYWRLESPIGPVFVAGSPRGISMVLRARSGAEFEREFRLRRGRSVVPARTAPPANLRALVRGEKRGKRAAPRVDLSSVTEFERAVLLKALEIPPGEVRPYSWIAKEIGQPGAVRAAGSALAKNPIPIVIPCHRVVRSDGHLGNYSLGGVRRKRMLLQVEGADPRVLENLADSGVRYLGNEGGRYYCYPTCGGLSALVLANQVRFGSDREATAAGYHPCEQCRPMAA